MKLTVANPLTTNLEKSYLTSSYSAGVTTININNNDRFLPSQKIMVGEMGHERTEVVTISTVTSPGTTFTLTGSGLVFAHDADTPVYVLKYDRVHFYRSVTGITGAYTLLADVAMDVDNANLSTIYDDTAGLTAYYYEVSFYGTYDTTETSLSDPIPGTGYPRGTAGYLINEVFAELGDMTQQNMSVDETINLINEVNDDLISQSRRPYRFLKTSQLLNITGGNPRVSLPTNLTKFDRMLYTNVFDQRTDSYRRISMDEMEYINYDNTTIPTDQMLYIAIDESTNELFLFPTPVSNATGGIKLFYWRKFNPVTSLAAVLETPNTRIYKLFLMGRYYRKRAVKEPDYMAISQQYLSDYNTEIVKLQRSNKIDIGTPQSLKPDTHHSRGLRRF